MKGLSKTIEFIEQLHEDALSAQRVNEELKQSIENTLAARKYDALSKEYNDLTQLWSATKDENNVLQDEKDALLQAVQKSNTITNILGNARKILQIKLKTDGGIVLRSVDEPESAIEFAVGSVNEPDTIAVMGFEAAEAFSASGGAVADADIIAEAEQAIEGEE